MSDIFENDIDDENENLAALEDSDIRKNTDGADENFVYPKPLYLVKLEYLSALLGFHSNNIHSIARLSRSNFQVFETKHPKGSYTHRQKLCQDVRLSPVNYK